MAECIYCAVGNHPLCTREAWLGHGLNAEHRPCACNRRKHRSKLRKMDKIVAFTPSLFVMVVAMPDGTLRRLCRPHWDDRKRSGEAVGVSGVPARDTEGCEDCDDARKPSPIEQACIDAHLPVVGPGLNAGVIIDCGLADSRLHALLENYRLEYVDSKTTLVLPLSTSSTPGVSQ